MMNMQPLSLWTVKKAEAESNEAEGTPNGITPNDTWMYGMRMPLSSGEPIAKHNLPFRPPTHMLPSEKPLQPPSPRRTLKNSDCNIMWRRSGTPPRPVSSPQQADPAGSNAACVPSLGWRPEGGIRCR
ncbi:unnamed protein product [Sphagnum jensenii]|uniref:Uncharacterized protein n=1 Tax=Sphagnum jensenii TaxID=128206 RepID=A0ABP1BK06_9BRYO